MSSLYPVELLGAEYEPCESLNSYVAVEIARADNSLPRLLQCFRAAARQLCESYPSPLLDELAAASLGSRVSKRSLESAALDEAVIEQICAAYLDLAAERRLVDISRHDPQLMADFVLSSLWDGQEWEADCTLFRHSWRIEHYYKAQGWDLLSPWIFAICSCLPSFRTIQKIDALLVQLEHTRGSMHATTILRKVGLPATDTYLDLIWFLCCNRAGVCIKGNGGDPEILASELAIPEFGLLSELSSVEGWVRNPCRTWKYRLGDPQEILADGAAIEAFGKKFGAKPAGISVPHIAIKIALDQLAVEETSQGLSEHLREVLIELLQKEERVVTVQDLRRTLGVPHLRIDPFGVTPGRVLVYAPSEKFLDSSRTAFVLRDWVQEPGRWRARIAPDRILTPLSPVVWKGTERDLLESVRKTDTFALCGISFWNDVKRSFTFEAAPQARRWADFHLLRQAQRTLKKHGFVVIADVFLSRFRWQHLPDTRAGLRQAVFELRDGEAWAEVRSHHPTGIVEVIDRLINS